MIGERSTREAAALILKRGLVALAVGIAVNLVILQTVFSFDLTGSTDDLEYQATVVVTTIGVVGATLVYALLTRLSANPNRTFVRVAAVVLVLSFLPNIALVLAEDGPATDEIIVLMVMHLPPAAACVASLTGWLFEPSRGLTDHRSG